MLLNLIKKELIGHILTFRFAVTFGLIILFVFAGFYVSIKEYRTNLDESYATKKMSEQSMERVLSIEDNWDRFHSFFGSHGVSNIIPVPALSFISQGLSRVWPTGFQTCTDDDFNIDKGLNRNPLKMVFPIPDFVYFVNIILSLLAILFIFDSVCGEKESGTLRLIFSFSVPRYMVLLSKWIGGFIPLFLPFFISVLAGLGYAYSEGVFIVSAKNIFIIGVLFFIAVLYISTFFSLGLFISTITKRAFTSLFISLFVWVACLLILPNLAPVFGKIISPIPSSRKIDAEKEAISKEIRLRMQYFRQQNGYMGYGKGVDEKRAELKEEKDSRIKRWDRFYKHACEKQTDISETIGRISPSTSWILSAFSLLSTGSGHYKKIAEAKSRIKREFREESSSIIEKCRKTGIWKPEVSEKNIPSLKIQSLSLSKIFADGLTDILLLIIFNVLFFMLSFMKFIKYDVR